jgi:regulator of replication initiation timing
MDKRLLRTLGFALVAGVFFGLAYGGMRNRIVFETAQMYDGLHSVELDSLRYQLDTLNQSYRDLMEIKVYDSNQVSRLTDDRSVLQVELNRLRERYSSLEEAYYTLKEKYEPEPPPEDNGTDEVVSIRFMGGYQLTGGWSVDREPVLPLPPWK